MGLSLFENRLLTDPSEPKRPRALTYTEMMHSGRQQMDKSKHAREQELQQRVEDLQKDVDQLEQALGQQS